MGTHLRELSNEYQHNRVKMVSNNYCVLVLRTKGASTSEVLNSADFHEAWPVEPMELSFKTCILLVLSKG